MCMVTCNKGKEEEKKKRSNKKNWLGVKTSEEK